MAVKPVTFDQNADPNDPVFHPFAPNQIYRTKSSFTKGASAFPEGLLLVFKRSGYGPYDNAIVYEFQIHEGQQKFQWWLWAGESSNLWQKFFDLI